MLTNVKLQICIGQKYNKTLVIKTKIWTFLVTQTVKNLPAMQETRVRSLGWEDPVKEDLATHSSILAWRIPWTEELANYSPWGHKGPDMTEVT